MRSRSGNKGKGTYIRTFHKFLDQMVERHTGPRSRYAFWDAQSGRMLSGFRSTAYTREGLAIRRLSRLKHQRGRWK